MAFSGTTMEEEGPEKKAGERIRTADVQLGNSVVRLQTLVNKTLMYCFSAENEDCKRLTG